MTKTNVEQLRDAHVAYCGYCGELVSLSDEENVIREDCPHCGDTHGLKWVKIGRSVPPSLETLIDGDIISCGRVWSRIKSG